MIIPIVTRGMNLLDGRLWLAIEPKRQFDAMAGVTLDILGSMRELMIISSEMSKLFNSHWTRMRIAFRSSMCLCR